MCRSCAIQTEVTRGADDALTENIVPESVDHDAGGQRVLWAGHPVGEFQAPLLFWFLDRHAYRAEDGQDVGGDDLAFLQWFAAVETVGFFRLAESPDPCGIGAGHGGDAGLGGGQIRL